MIFKYNYTNVDINGNNNNRPNARRNGKNSIKKRNKINKK